ncbi:MAG: hypothetical protein OXE42_09340 [Gammaproteobacteria bacterium]|nr:hypothetical protein [Gammaproteobacteria bacterium]
MKKHHTARPVVFYFLLVLFCGNPVADEAGQPVPLEQQVRGLWFYTGLITSSGEDLPLDGIFLFGDDLFLQYAQYKGEPARDQGAMAHAGPYSAGEGFIGMVAEQTISTAPSNDPPLNYRGLTEHEVDVMLVDNEMTLTFMRSGTVQIFERAGPGEGDVYRLENGALAFVDGYLILVSGDENGVETGYGRYEADNGALSLDITYWTSADQSSASNTNHTAVNATFDGQVLTLEGGRRFQVLR